jgi:hypothetical protein
MRDLALGPVVSWALGFGDYVSLDRLWMREGGLTLGEVGDSRSLRGETGMCRGLGRTLSGRLSRV